VILSISKVRIYDYENYRKFLNDTYLQNKASDRKFSFRFFAKAAGYKSPSILLEIIKGKRNLSIDGIDRFTRAFKFNQEEAIFFRNLVLLNQAVTGEERLRYAREITKSRTYRKIHPLADSQYRYFKHWYYTAVRGIVALPEFKDDPQWIASHIIPAISVQEVTRAIEELVKLGLLKRDENNRLVQTESILSTPDEVSSTYVSNWHKEYLKRASESIDTVSREKRDISAVYFAFPIENMKSVKDLVSKFRREVLELASVQQGKNSVVQLNLQLFPIATTSEEES
jgi:uncharacterized protein (TIGR02147 family)